MSDCLLIVSNSSITIFWETLRAQKHLGAEEAVWGDIKVGWGRGEFRLGMGNAILDTILRLMQLVKGQRGSQISEKTCSQLLLQSTLLYEGKNFVEKNVPDYIEVWFSSIHSIFLHTPSVSGGRRCYANKTRWRSLKAKQTETRKERLSTCENQGFPGNVETLRNTCLILEHRAILSQLPPHILLLLDIG